MRRIINSTYVTLDGVIQNPQDWPSPGGFSDQGNQVQTELLERCAVSTFQRTDMNDVMLHLRDDLLFAGRGASWVRYEKDGDAHNVCVEHKDRLDFLHEPARKWAEVGWVAGAAWMTRTDEALPCWSPITTCREKPYRRQMP